MMAAAYASGLIVFGRSVPKGALPIARGPARMQLIAMKVTLLLASEEDDDGKS